MEQGQGPDRGLGGVEGGGIAGRAQAASVSEVPVTGVGVMLSLDSRLA
jgi:hypothetical protein